MQRFSYKAKDLKGKYKMGLVEAKDIKEAATLLKERNLFIINLAESKHEVIKSVSGIVGKVSYSDIVNFTRQLATMVTAGLTLSEALAILKIQTTKAQLLKIVSQIEEDVEGGRSFASAIEKFPDTFSPVYRSLIKAGEASGKLDDVLNRLADNLEKSREFRSKTKGALVYPAIVLTGMVIVMFILMTFVVPKLTAMYKDFGVTLPLPTQILILISTILANYWYLIIGLGIVAVYLFRRWRKTKSGSEIWDRFVLSLPLLGNVFRESTLVEMTRTLSILIGAGIPILQSLEIAQEAVGSYLYKDAVKEVSEQVEKGFPLGTPFSENPLFPPILGQMVNVGEETGKLDESLMKLSKYFEQESEVAVKALTTAIEPLIMVILGVGVGFVVISILLPIYSLTSQF